MKIGSYEFDIKRARSELEKTGAEKILLQLPDGLRHKAEKFREQFEQDVSIWGGSCYGACDLPSDIGDNDALLHVGHSEIPNLDVDYDIIYLPGKSVRFEGSPEELFEKLEGKVALYAPVQHLYQFEKMADRISRKGHETVIGEGDNRMKHPGQVLGCNYTAVEKDADTHLYIGTGRFHPIGLSFALDEDVVMYNPSTKKVDVIGKEERETLLRKRFAAISLCREASTVGIIVSRKIGQERMKTAEQLQKMGKESGKDMVMIELEEIDKRAIDDLNLDCVVNTACPRIVLDDADSFDTVLLTPEEFKIAMEKKDWEDWEMDQIN
ncbi:MAG: diphthamide biosynthesis enzyme Dph2 [Thermoplasmata archaeon]